MRKAVLASLLAAAGVATASAQANQVILPGFLDLPLSTGQKFEVHATDYPYRSAFIVATDGADDIRVDPYVEALRSKGWEDHPRSESNGLVLRLGKGDDAVCVLASGGLTVNSNGNRGPYFSIHFQQWECEYDTILLPGAVDLRRTPGYWLEANTSSFARIITTEGFRQRSFDIYVEELKGLGWRSVERGEAALLMRRSAAGPCLGVLHYKDSASQLNLVDFHFFPTAAECSLPSPLKEATR